MAGETMPGERGVLVVLEGVDRCGKSTQAQMLLMTQNKAVLMRFPNRQTATGKVIDDYLNQRVELHDRAIHLLYAANRWEASDSIIKALEEGKMVVMDRYSFSGVAFSCAKGLDYEWCWAPEKGLPAPDVAIYLDLPADEAKKRSEYGKERYEVAEFQTKVRLAYAKFSPLSSWKILRADQSKEDLHREIVKLVSETAERVKDKPINYFYYSSSRMVLTTRSTSPQVAAEATQERLLTCLRTSSRR